MKSSPPALQRLVLSAALLGLMTSCNEAAPGSPAEDPSPSIQSRLSIPLALHPGQEVAFGKAQLTSYDLSGSGAELQDDEESLLIRAASEGEATLVLQYPSDRSVEFELRVLGCGAQSHSEPIDLSAGSAGQVERDYVLRHGDQQSVASTNVASYSIEGESVVVTVDPETSDFVMSARSLGATSLLVLRQDGKRVLARFQVTECGVISSEPTEAQAPTPDPTHPPSENGRPSLPVRTAGDS